MRLVLRSCPFVLVTAVAGCGMFGKDGDLDSSKQSVLTAGVHFVDGNPTCADLGLGTASIKIDPPATGTYALDAINTVTVTVSSDGTHFDWSSTLGIDAVIAKGGSAANVYVYDPEATSDTNLVSPLNGGDQVPTLSHMDFCFDYEVKVTKTAATSLTRTFTWSIDKKADNATDLTLALGETYTMPYTVDVAVGSAVDSNWAMNGTVTVQNPAPIDATIESVSDTFGASSVALSCGVTFPYVLAAGQSLACTYASPLAGPSDGTNSVTVTTSGAVEGGSATAAVDFASASVTGVDDCIAVNDDKYGSLGTVCAADAPKSFHYTLGIGPYAICGVYAYENTASFVGDDTGATGSHQVIVGSTIPCAPDGCTLTQGYWKTHSSHGPAPYDDNWAQLPNGADTTFFLSGMSYYQVLQTPVSGNAYYSLAHQYIAAQLNGLNGAPLASVQAAFDAATTLLSTYTPADVAAMNKGSALRKQLVDLASQLDAYNRGVVGPGHCSE